MTTLRATYEHGQIHLLDEPPVSESKHVLVTFLEEDEPQTVKMTGKEFVAKWGGAFKDMKIGDLKEEIAQAILEKHR